VRAGSARASIWGDASLASWVIASVFLTVACGRAPLPDPEPTALAYADAVRARDAASLRELLTLEGRAGYSEEVLARLLEENEKELSARVALLGEGPGLCEARWEAKVELADGSEVELVREAGVFRLQAPAGLRGRPTSVLGAIEELRRALEARDLPALLDLLATPRRQELERLIDDIGRGLEDARGVSEEEVVSGVVVRLGNGRRITLTLEDGTYRIVEIE
jgi:hypothetical protein